MSASIVTYYSRNSSPSRQWLAYIERPSGRLPISFFAATEEEVKEKVRHFWLTEQQKAKRLKSGGGETNGKGS